MSEEVLAMPQSATDTAGAIGEMAGSLERVASVLTQSSVAAAAAAAAAAVQAVGEGVVARFW